MDEGLLNDLLECSVCLERLDTSSRVLPCQHTFCIKCLKEILAAHKELRCPECRVLVDVPLEALPPNVLLMRILEGMRGRGGPGNKQTLPAVAADPAPVSSPLQAPGFTYSSGLEGGKQSYVLPASTPHARALYDYVSQEPRDLSFKKGDIIILRRRIDSHWYQGESGGKWGAFPITYVQVLVPLVVPMAQCKTLYDFRMSAPDEEGCLAFDKGQVISVLRRVDDNWAEGRLLNQQRIGIFPIAFVEMNAAAQALLKLHHNSAASSSRAAPPAPGASAVRDLTSPAPNTAPAAQNRQATSQIQYPVSRSTQPSGVSTSGMSQSHPVSNKEGPALVLSGSSSSASTPSLGGGGTSDTSTSDSTSPTQHYLTVTSEASPPAQHIPYSPSGYTLLGNSGSSSPAAQHKRHSLTHDLTTPYTHNQRHSAEILSTPATEGKPSEPQRETHRRHEDRDRPKRRTASADRHLPAAFIALYPYKPTKPDELQLIKGMVYTVVERCQDGWYKGYSSRTQKHGVFPGNYVAPASKVCSRQKHHPNNTNGDSALGQQEPSASLSPSPASTLTAAPPDLPPRDTTPGCSPATPISSKNNQTKQPKSADKSVGLMKRLAGISKARSPQGQGFSMDNPVFEDCSVDLASLALHFPQATPQHVRSSGDVPWLPVSTRHQHRKSQSLDAAAHTPAAAPQVAPQHPHPHQPSASTNTPQPRQRKFRCIVAYPPNSEYELELRVDDVVTVHKKWGEGWYKGTLQRTGRTGLFPASFVEAC